ncbi:MFS transporter [Candidatus Pyrohabitans sp.]
MNDKKHMLWAGFLVVFFASVAFYLIKPALALKVRADLHATAIEITAITSGFMVSRAIAAPLAGVAGDRSPALRNYMVRVSLFPITLVAIAYAYVPEAFLAVLLSTVHGFFSGMLWPTLQVIVGFSAPEDRRGAYLGAYFTVAALGSGAGYALYGFLPLSSTHIILTGALLYALSALLALALFSTSRTLEIYPGHGRKRDKLSFRGFSRLTTWVLAISFAIGGILGLMNEYLYIFLYEVHGLTKGELGYVLTLATLLGVSSSIFSGFLSDRFGIRSVLVFILLLSSAGLFSLALSASKLGIALSLAAVLLTGKATLPLTRNIAMAGNPAIAGTVVGLSNTLSNAGSAIFPLIAGYIYDTFESEMISGIDGRAMPLILSSLVVLFLAFLSPLARERKY